MLRSSMNVMKQLQQRGAKVAVCKLSSAHLLILPSKLFLEKITLCKLVKEAPLRAGTRFHVHTLVTGEVIANAKVECSKVPCCMVKILKPPAQTRETLVIHVHRHAVQPISPWQVDDLQLQANTQPANDMR